MNKETPNAALTAGLVSAMTRAGFGHPRALHRLTGGATMESWRFEADGEPFVLRRAPSLAMMTDRPFGHATEAAIIRAARAAGVTAPEIVIELEPQDGIGSGFVMRALPGTPDPRAILAMDDPGRLLGEAARDLARIHAIDRADLPSDIPAPNTREAIADLRTQFEEAGGDRPIIALGLKWLEDNCPPDGPAVLNHGDFRLGNLLAEDSQLTGVLDWELAHYGDWHEDLAFGCMTVWRFARIDRPALGLGMLEDYFSAYEAAGGRAVDRARFHYWLVHRTVWWALGCLKMARIWREGQDRMLERVVISRRTSEQELDLLMLLEEEAPEFERMQGAFAPVENDPPIGESSPGEIATAVLEWLETVKDRMEGHDRFQHAVARNALGIVARQEQRLNTASLMDPDIIPDLLSGRIGLADSGLLADLRRYALDKVEVDSPKYPALSIAKRKWLGED